MGVLYIWDAHTYMILIHFLASIEVLHTHTVSVYSK